MKNVFKTSIDLKVLIFTIVFLRSTVFSIGYNSSIHEYKTPSCELVNQHGEKVSLTSIIDFKKPIVLDFFYSSCRSVCPLMSASFANFQYRLSKKGEGAQLISITIDPRKDRSKVLMDYMERFRAGPGWNFLTGDPICIAEFIKTFSQFTKKKMGYFPLTYIFLPVQGQWIQIEGFISADDLIKEYHKATCK